MSTSAAYSFDLTVGQVIQLALTDVGAVGPGMTAQPEQLAHARLRLNALVKSLDARGALLWRIIRRTATTTSGTDNIVPAADVLDLDGMGNYVRSGTTARSLVVPMSRSDYMAVGDRTVSGTPTRYFVERTLTGITVYLHPVPDASGDTFEYSAVVKAKDNTTDANTQDFMQKWGRCLEYGLALDLCHAYAVPVERVAVLRDQYESELDILLNDDNERGPIQLVPWGTYYGGPYHYRSED